MEKLTKYMEICKFFQEEIDNGAIIPGEKLPTELEIVQKFSVSRHTVRQALNELEKLGYIYKEKSRGAFCADIHKENIRIPKLVMVITTYISDYIFPNIIRGIEEILSTAGYDVLLFSTNNQKEKEAEQLQRLLSYNIVGAIIEPTASAQRNSNIDLYLKLNKKNIPYVMINAAYENINKSYVILNDEDGGYRLCKHLIDLGHKRIAGIFIEDDLQGVKRKNGYIKALKEANIEIDNTIIGGYHTFEQDFYPQAFTKAILQKENNPSAIICYNDKIALQVIQSVKELDLKIPKDISIVGFDNDTTIGASLGQVLTTINHPKEDLGKKAADILIKLIEKQIIDEKYVFPAKVLVKESTNSYINIFETQV